MESSIKDFKILALSILALGKNWSFSNDKLTWNDASAQPTDAEIDAKCVELKEEHDALEYARNRKVEYPEMADQLDMIYWDGINETTTHKDAIAAIKAKYPKP